MYKEKRPRLKPTLFPPLPTRLLALGLLAFGVFASGLLALRLFAAGGTCAAMALDALKTQAGNAMTINEYPSGPLQDGLTFDRLVLKKSERSLTAYHKGKSVRIYFVALGTSPVGAKEFEGDRKTPEGVYAIDGKNPNSKFYKNLGVSYPNAKDRAHAATKGKSPGGDIKIHGLPPDAAHLGSLHRLNDWTHGCIAVTNEEIDELYARTPVGAEIEILP